MTGLPVIGGLLSAATWGTGDFLGGMLSKRAHPVGVAVAMQVIGTLLLAAGALIVREPAPPLAGVLWAGAAGVTGGLALLVLYTALAAGTMGIVAPLTGVVAAAVPIVVAALTQGAPGLMQTGGFLLALAAVWLLAGGGLRGLQSGLPAAALLAGLGFGFYFVLMAKVGSSGFFWPMTVARTVATLSLLVYARAMGQPAALPRALLPAATLVALFDTGGNAFYLWAAQSGRLDTVAVLSSLYPAATVTLAGIVLKERLSPPQWVGVAAALAAIPLIAA